MTDRPIPTEPVYLTLAEAAAYLRVSERTMQRYVEQGQVRAYRTPGSHPRFRPADLEAAMTGAGDAA